MTLKLVDLDQITERSLFFLAVDLQFNLEPIQRLGIKLILGYEVVEVIDGLSVILLNVAVLGCLRFVLNRLGDLFLRLGLALGGVAKSFGSNRGFFVGD